MLVRKMNLDSCNIEISPQIPDDLLNVTNNMYCNYSENLDLPEISIKIPDILTVSPGKRMDSPGSASSNQTSQKEITVAKKAFRRARPQFKQKTCKYCRERVSYLLAHIKRNHFDEPDVDKFLDFDPSNRMYQRLRCRVGLRPAGNYKRCSNEKYIVTGRPDSPDFDYYSPDNSIELPCGPFFKKCLKVKHKETENSADGTFVVEQNDIAEENSEYPVVIKLDDDSETADHYQCENEILQKYDSDEVKTVNALFVEYEEDIKQALMEDSLLLDYVKLYVRQTPPYSVYRKLVKLHVRYLRKYMMVFRETSSRLAMTLEECFALANFVHLPQVFVNFSDLNAGYNNVAYLAKCVLQIFKLLCARASSDANVVRSKRVFVRFWKTRVCPSLAEARTRMQTSMTTTAPDRQTIAQVSNAIDDQLQMIRFDIDRICLDYFAFTFLLVTKIALFNYTRGVNPLKLTIDDYQRRGRYDRYTLIRNFGFADYEARVAEHMDVAVIKGVEEKDLCRAVILTPDMIKLINRILFMRNSNFVMSLDTDLPLFMNVAEQTRVLDLSSCFQYSFGIVNAVEPSILYAPNLRKYIGTAFQWINMSDEKRLRLARYLIAELDSKEEIQSIGLYSPVPVVLMAMSEGVVLVNKSLETLTEDDEKVFIELCCNIPCRFSTDDINLCTHSPFLKLESWSSSEVELCGKQTVELDSDSEHETAFNQFSEFSGHKMTWNDGPEKVHSRGSSKRGYVRWTPEYKKTVEKYLPDILKNPNTLVKTHTLQAIAKELAEKYGVTVSTNALRSMVYWYYKKPFLKKANNEIKIT